MNNKMKTIGIFAPSKSIGQISNQLIDTGIQKLREIGFNCKFSKNCKSNYRYLSGTISQRVADFHDLLDDPEIDLIMSFYGGYNTNELLEHLDFDLVEKSDKKIVGFSDFTAVLNAIYSKLTIESYHGPAFINFCDPNISDETIKSFKFEISHMPQYLISPSWYAYDAWYLKDGFGPRERHKHPGWIVVTPGKMEGILIGGNIDTFLSIIGTPFMPDHKGTILLLEGPINMNVGEFRRGLTQLRQSKVLSEIKGLIFGQTKFLGMNIKDSNTNLIEIVRLVTDGYTYPILANTNFSHIDPIFTLPIGGRVRVEVKDKPVVHTKI